ncbi:hypothetical protein AB1A81_04940 [Bdellovibrio bacteriovorus]|uniref:Uncharacterized protein n=1 Tax=Bdellovibrio bacteriovorus (strain ATCC 15356 / DSM 50701 / NCIMB 9529 / HD100) TaxID=264462 RepID=Q6MNZ9_BDEBA|nr:hypothetical protein [Bdellovibrio bacteriovorus]AHZ86315.1 hypothetical protein EP01_15430 [Bdellovibrio bacteriovorus]BEV67553.1 hypothetical protein Bb109J_c0973 [Bdellovibrio bacteriovorus]CAE79000.1 hypothetical protein predicted by Glimmer/Critica [Bdellovibrio bacteriovorus HD100]
MNLSAVLFVLLSVSFSQAAEKTFQCRGDFKNSNLIFRYSLMVDGKNSRSRLMFYKEDRMTKDFGWKKFASASGKIVVDSPWLQYRAYLVPASTVYELVLAEPATDVQIDDLPFSRFYCVKFLPYFPK